ncbi:MAG: carboxypeptidase-like regulatory domain-containing protein, partial [Candidatus Acidiferrales bacterium]
YWLLIVLLPTLALFAGSAEAQADTGTFHGKATDSSGTAVPAASVLLVNQGTGAGINFTGDAQGYFESNPVPIRKYTARTAATDFSPVKLKDVILEFADHRELTLALHVRGTSSVAHVSESSVSLLETTISNLSQVIHEQNIVQLALNGRKFVQLGTLLFSQTRSSG